MVTNGGQISDGLEHGCFRTMLRTVHEGMIVVNGNWGSIWDKSSLGMMMNRESLCSGLFLLKPSVDMGSIGALALHGGVKNMEERV
jgi:hypothetical protein